MNRLSLDNYRWIPWAITGCFVVVIAVNISLAYFALHSDTGLVTAHPFELGTGYNAVLDEAAAEDALGWQGAVRFADAGDGHGTLTVALTDKGGTPLSGATISGRIVRPLGAFPDSDLDLKEAASGTFTAPVGLPQAGQWEARLVARRGNDVYQFQQRIVVR